MGVSMYPNPADGGMVCLLVACTVKSIFFFRYILLSLLRHVGIHIAPVEEEPVENPWDWQNHRSRTPSTTFVELFLNKTPALRFHNVWPEQECIVCLREFEQDAEVDCLRCGHVFHRMCLEKWLKYQKLTCPLCRTYMVPQEGEDTASM